MKPHLFKPLWSAAVALMFAPAASASNVFDHLQGTPWAASYQVGEQGGADDGGAQPAESATANQGPVRLARFSYVRGNVTWRSSASEDWSAASVNLPLRQGAQVWVSGGRAEIQFDDGSLLRLGNGAIVTLQTLYSDTDGEFTELQMNQGLAALRLRHADSIFQVDTPFASVKSVGPSKVRIGVNDDVEVAVRDGSAAVEGHDRKTTLQAGDYVDLTDPAADYQISPLPDPDSWDTWNDDRDRQLADADSGQRLPSDIALVAGNLDDYGQWHHDSRYGDVWVPSVQDTDWRPYQHGHWVWVEPFGWTWVSSEAWGWAPYHYGTWVDEPYGWGWVPGPVHQYWCPAVVHLSEYNGNIAWCPLAPAEVRYPSILSIGFRSGDWAANFSIGGCAVYYPSGGSYCEPRPFRNVIVNRTVYVNNVTNITNNSAVYLHPHTSINRNVYVTNNQFVPQNARSAGVTTASVAAFGGQGTYQAAPRVSTAYFSQGRSIGAPRASAAPFSGPIAARPTAEAFTPSRTFLPSVRPTAGVLERPMVRAALPARVARFAPPVPEASGTRIQGGRTPFERPQNTVPASGLPRTVRQPEAGSVTPRWDRPQRTLPPTSGDGAREAARAARESLGRHTTDGVSPGGGFVPRNGRYAPGENAAPLPQRQPRNESRNSATAPDFPREQPNPRSLPSPTDERATPRSYRNDESNAANTRFGSSRRDRDASSTGRGAGRSGGGDSPRTDRHGGDGGGASGDRSSGGSGRR